MISNTKYKIQYDLQIQQATNKLNSWFVKQSMERKGDVGKLSIVQESGRDQHDIDGGGDV